MNYIVSHIKCFAAACFGVSSEQQRQSDSKALSFKLLAGIAVLCVITFVILLALFVSFIIS